MTVSTTISTTTSTTVHAPKWSALHAYVVGALSPAGEARLLRHVEGCAVCHDALGAIAAYQQTCQDVQALPGPVSDAPARGANLVTARRAAQDPAHDAAWLRLLAALRTEGADTYAEVHADEVLASPTHDSHGAEDTAETAYERISAEIRLTPAPPIPDALADRVLEARAAETAQHQWTWTALLAAAACFALAARLFGAPAPHASRDLPPTHAAEVQVPGASAVAPGGEPAPELAVHVRAFSGAPRVERSPLSLGARVHEGERCETDNQDSAHFSVGETSGFSLTERGVATVERAREDGVSLALERGAVSSLVRTGLPYRVLAPPYAFEVRGTRFSVARRDDGAVSARVAEGAVAVTREGRVLVILEAGESWSSAGAAFAPEPHVWSPRAGVGLHVPAPPNSPFVEFEAESVTWDAHADAELTVQEGASLALTFYDARGRPTEVHTGPISEGGTVEVPVASRLVRGHLPRRVISAVVREHRRDLDFCVARAVRMAGRALGDLTLRLTISPEGAVSDVQISGAGATVPLRACLSAKARLWAFPRPGGDLPVHTQMRLAVSSGAPPP